MVRVIAHNGNYLLNIGPKSDGSVPKESVEILHQLGQWVKLNSEAIFDTECTPYRADSMTTHEWGTCTRRDSTLYLFVQNWPEDGKIDLPLIKNHAKEVSYLAVANKAKLQHSRSIDSRGNTVITIDVRQAAQRSRRRSDHGCGVLVEGDERRATSAVGGEAPHLLDHTPVPQVHAVVGADGDDRAFARERW